eukprot:CAMPEP_0201476624 /NCGR_PEP_ID=MMETSP0151_2-20130828/1791_1 /ASSEMBLY_ACC=CAM_ASM_000257 /TAXON_ID=200890 /ORGANISM="Paramoeba atlantica, Strain 621/1 / CCAP 1560/9" /LENGTH=129 /DNA_ID=CAMNT_0047857043 /DNA_START=299 /DNA_END=688 /DNA_ORIENTATION=+
MSEKLTGGLGVYAVITGCAELIDHMNSIIPKDEYEIKRMTSYMLSRKHSEEYRRMVIQTWVKCLFTCESTNYAGYGEMHHQQAGRMATEEEFMAYVWFVLFMCTVGAATLTGLYWYWKYGQGFEVVPIQ